MPTPPNDAANGGGQSRLQPPRFVATVSELGSLGALRCGFHLMAVTADVTDFEFQILAYYVSGTFQPGMLVRFRPSARLLCTYVLHSIGPKQLQMHLRTQPPLSPKARRSGTEKA